MAKARKLKKEEVVNVQVPEEEVPISDEFENGVEVQIEYSVNSNSRVLIIDLGESLKKGDVISEEVLANLKTSGFTEERLFGN